MNLRDIEWAARTITEYTRELLHIYSQAVDLTQQALSDGAKGPAAREAVKMLVTSVRDADPPSVQRGRGDAWILLGAPEVMGHEAGDKLYEEVANLGVDAHGIHKLIAARLKSLEPFLHTTARLAAKADLLLEVTKQPPSSLPGLSVRFPDNVSLDGLAEKARDLDNALKSFAVLAKQPAASPMVANVESGSLELDVLLDPQTWSLVTGIIRTVADGLKLLTDLWGLRKNTAAQNLPVEPIEKRIEEEREKLAKKALDEVRSHYDTVDDPEARAKAQRGTTYMLEIITAGATVRVLGSGPDVDPQQVNRLLATAEPTIQTLLSPSGTQGDLPRDPTPKMLGPGGPGEPTEDK